MCIEPWGKPVNRVLLFILHLISQQVRMKSEDAYTDLRLIQHTAKSTNKKF